MCNNLIFVTSKKKLFELVKSFYNSGLPHLLISIVFIQGGNYIYQLISARILGPQNFGVVRHVEALISILLVLGSAGMSSLAVTCIAETTDPVVRGRILGRLIKLSFLASVTLAIFINLIPYNFGNYEVSRYLKLLVWSIVLTSCTRTCINYFLGIKRIQKISLFTAGLSLVSLSIMIILVWYAGLTGWVIGRYLYEIVLLTLVIFFIWNRVRFRGSLPISYSQRQLILLGSPIALSLLVRVALENTAVLSLDWFDASRAEIGYYGVSSIVIIVLLILPAGIGNLSIAQFTERAYEKKQVRKLFVRITSWSLLVMSFITCLAYLFSPWAIHSFSDEYLPAIPIVRVLLLIVPLRTITVICGAVFLAYNRNVLTLIINLFLLVVSLVFYTYSIPLFGVIGAAWSTIFTEGIGTIIYLCGVFRQLKN